MRAIKTFFYFQKHNKLNPTSFIFLYPSQQNSILVTKWTKCPEVVEEVLATELEKSIIKLRSHSLRAIFTLYHSLQATLTHSNPPLPTLTHLYSLTTTRTHSDLL